MRLMCNGILKEFATNFYLLILISTHSENTNSITFLLIMFYSLLKESQFLSTRTYCNNKLEDNWLRKLLFWMFLV